MNNVQEQIKVAGDVLSIATVLGTLAAWLPPLAALFTIIWTTIRIIETRTVQGWLRRRRCKRKAPECQKPCPQFCERFER